MADDRQKKNFLFLQGVCSPFFAKLADCLESAGHSVLKVNFNAGDLAYWGGRRSISFRGRLADLKEFLSVLYRKHDITDQVLFGDRRPIHRSAIDRADALDIRTHVFEEGYFRPYWVTLEREGVNGHSLLPRDPDWFWAVGGDLPYEIEVQPFDSSFRIRALHDVLYHLAGAGNSLLYPHYRTHAPISAPLEYLGYACRFSMLRLWAARDEQTISRLLSKGEKYYVLPLQLNSDAQIRDHSRFANMAEVMDFVMESFARHAPQGSRLVIKNHPLDMGLSAHRSVIGQLEKKYALRGRVDYLETGNLDTLLAPASGLVTVNSTVGSVALGAKCPTISLSDPIYNLPGLTFQGGLDDFWREGIPPNAELFRRFRNTVIHCSQLNGGFYSGSGIELAVRNASQILTADYSPLEVFL